jgi:hypothetical protein
LASIIFCIGATLKNSVLSVAIETAVAKLLISGTILQAIDAIAVITFAALLKEVPSPPIRATGSAIPFFTRSAIAKKCCLNLSLLLTMLSIGEEEKTDFESNKPMTPAKLSIVSFVAHKKPPTVIKTPFAWLSPLTSPILVIGSIKPLLTNFDMASKYAEKPEILSDIVNNSYQTTQRRNAAATKIQQMYKKHLPSLRYKRHLKEHKQITPSQMRKQTSDALNKLREQLRVHRFGRRKF